MGIEGDDKAAQVRAEDQVVGVWCAKDEVQVDGFIWELRMSYLKLSSGNSIELRTKEQLLALLDAGYCALDRFPPSLPKNLAGAEACRGRYDVCKVRLLEKGIGHVGQVSHLAGAVWIWERHRVGGWRVSEGSRAVGFWPAQSIIYAAIPQIPQGENILLSITMPSCQLPAEKTKFETKTPQPDPQLQYNELACRWEMLCGWCLVRQPVHC